VFWLRTCLQLFEVLESLNRILHGKNITVSGMFAAIEETRKIIVSQKQRKIFDDIYAMTEEGAVAGKSEHFRESSRKILSEKDQTY
jgi:hypothetical protein